MAEIAAIQFDRLADVDWSTAQLRVRPADESALFHLKLGRRGATVIQALELPEPTRTTDSAIWLGPREWLLPVSRERAPRLRSNLENMLAGGLGWFVEVSDQLVAIDIGERSAVVTLTGLPDAALAAGRVARTRIGEIAATLVGLESGGVRVFVDRSYGRYLRRWVDLAV